MKRTKFSFLLVFLLFSVNVFAQYEKGYTERGVISYYTKGKSPRTTASGEKYDNEDLVACHAKLPFNTKVKVTNLANNKSVIVRINDRGPYAYGRIMDVSEAAAKKIDLVASGTAKADIEVISEALPAGDSPMQAGDKKDDSNGKIVTAVNEAQFQINTTYSQWGTVKNPIGFTIQTGSFDTYKKAVDFCKILREKGFKDEKIFIEVTGDEAKKVFKVLLGEFEDKPQANGLASKYKINFGKEPWIRKHVR